MRFLLAMERADQPGAVRFHPFAFLENERREASAAPALDRVIEQQRPLRLAEIGDDDHFAFVAFHEQGGRDLVVFLQLDAAHAGGDASHRADFRSSKRMLMPSFVTSRICCVPSLEQHLHHFVAVRQLHGRDGRAGRLVFLQRGPLHLAALRDEQERQILPARNP